MSNTIHTFRCNCGQRMNGRVLEQLARKTNPSCPGCCQPLDQNEIRYAANVKDNECKGPMLLPAVFISIGLTALLTRYMSYAMPQAMPLAAMAMVGITLLSSVIFLKKGGSFTVALSAGIFFGPLAAVFLAVVGPWRTTSAAELNRQNNTQPSLDFLNARLRR